MTNLTTLAERIEGMGNVNVEPIDGVAVLFPKYDKVEKIVKIGRFALFCAIDISQFAVGVQLLKAGGVIYFGPFLFGFAHIKRQLAAFEALDALRARVDSAV